VHENKSTSSVRDRNISDRGELTPGQKVAVTGPLVFIRR